MGNLVLSPKLIGEELRIDQGREGRVREEKAERGALGRKRPRGES
jgi:hypothetical protein